MSEWNAYDAYKKYAVEADSVADFLARWYKPNRYTGRGAEYAAALLASYQRQFAEQGFCHMSHHDSVRGQVTAWYGPKKTEPPPDSQLQLWAESRQQKRGD